MRYVIGFLISIGLLIVIFVLIFHHGSAPGPSIPQLTTYANTDTQVRFIDDYPITSQQTHHETVTTVGKDQVTFTVENGYDGSVLRSQSYQNTNESYRNFLAALQVEGYTKGNHDPKLQDETGQCPTGHRYIYEIVSGSRLIQHLWTTSCGGGTFSGQSATVRGLYRQQVPDYNKLLQGVGGSGVF